MEDLQKNEFVQTTIKTAKNERLEIAIEESKKSAEKLKSFNSSNNKLVRFLAWTNTMILLFFVFPIILSGLFSKGMTSHSQKIIWVTILLCILFGILKNVII